MGLLDWVATGEWQPETENRELESIAVTDINWVIEQKISQLTGVSDSSIPAAYRAAQFIADTVASLHMVQVDVRSNVRDLDTPSLLVLPDPTETYHDTLHKLVMSLIWRGNAYFRPLTVGRNGLPASIQVLHPDDVTVNWDRQRLYPQYTWRGRKMARNRDIYHIAINLYPGECVGVGPITAARLLWETMKEEATYQKNLLADNATPSGLLHSQERLTAAEADEVREVWEGAHKGRKRVGVTSGTIEFKPLTIDPVDAQFLEARTFSVQEVARLFGIPGLFLGVATGDSLTYSTTESLNRLFVSTTLRPTYLERIEQTFGLLLPRGKVARFDIDELLRADIKARYEAHQIGIISGFKTPNEARNEEGLPPLLDGDSLRQPTQTQESLNV